ncbi:MAG: hypothetical protein COT73_12730 [Bdellovibrio sp. CG10_big_fil_rev_8_21_14_0_10_47_8]|nr:MAG: hypothetical protein COT73_12730 [Bdellovibrio sp. CG10_big_fil_rev_8_21_14_0_10_47_8]
MNRFVLSNLLTLALLVPLNFVMAADSSAVSTTKNTTKSSSSSLLKSVVFGYKSYNDTGRFGYTNKDLSKDAFDGRTYKGKHEAKLGYKHESGWGAYGQITQYRYDYNESSAAANRWSASDPSLTLTHPAWYKSSDLMLLGSARYYVPNTDRSKALGVKQISYYFDLVYKMGSGQEIFNDLNPRAFVQDRYGDSDTRYKLEDVTVYTKTIGQWGRWGVGQWTQYEQHAATAPGLTMDVFPQFDYLITPKIFLGPRLYLPVLVQNSVYDGSKAATFENAYLELFLQASL